MRLVKHRKEAETLVEHLDYDRYSEQRKANFIKQSQQASNDQRAYDKSMEKHQRVKQNVETALRATKDSTAGRLLAKKMKNVLSQEKRFEKTAQSMTQKPLEEEEIRLFFSNIQPLPASKVLIQLEKEKFVHWRPSFGSRTTTNCPWPRKNRYYRPKWYWEINSISQIKATS